MEAIELHYLPQGHHLRSSSNDPVSDDDNPLVTQYIESIDKKAKTNNAVKQYYNQLVNYLTGRGGPQQVIREFNVTYGEPLLYPNGDASPRGTRSSTATQHPKVVVLEGFPSPKRIARLGTLYQLSPDFFIGNLDFSQKVTQGTATSYYEMPALPSASQDAIHFRFVSLGLSPLGTFTGSPTEYQKTINVRCRQNQASLFEGNLYGTTRWRQVQTHGRHWSLEQVLSFTVSTRGSSWTAVFLSDLGRSDDGSFDGLPWNKPGCEANHRPVGTIPLIGSCPTPNTLVTSSLRKVSVADLDQFHPLKRLRFTDAMDHRLYLQDPFYLYHSILRTMLDSWTQLINFLDTDVEACHNASTDAVAHSLEQLRLTSSTLYRARNTILEHLPIVKLGGLEQWPKSVTDELMLRKSVLQQELELAINALVERYTNLLHECQTVSQLFVSSSQVTESQKAIQQSKEINALTQLAFTFVPGGFIAAIFSMSVKELRDGPPRIWIFFAVAVPVMLTFSLLTVKAVRQPFLRIGYSVRDKGKTMLRDRLGFEVGPST